MTTSPELPVVGILAEKMRKPIRIKQEDIGTVAKTLGVALGTMKEFLQTNLQYVEEDGLELEDELAQLSGQDCPCKQVIHVRGSAVVEYGTGSTRPAFIYGILESIKCDTQQGVGRFSCGGELDSTYRTLSWKVFDVQLDALDGYMADFRRRLANAIVEADPNLVGWM